MPSVLFQILCNTDKADTIGGQKKCDETTDFEKRRPKMIKILNYAY